MGLDKNEDSEEINGFMQEQRLMMADVMEQHQDQGEPVQN